MKLKQNFTKKDIEIDIKQFLDPRLKLLLPALNYLGIEFVSKARTATVLVTTKKPLEYPHSPTGFYDLSANLRSSIGYVILDGNTKKEEDFMQFGDGSKGKATGLEKGIEVAKQYKGLKLVVVAGMEYATYVEAKGYDVITNSIPLKSHVEAVIKQFTELK